MEREKGASFARLLEIGPLQHKVTGPGGTVGLAKISLDFSDIFSVG